MKIGIIGAGKVGVAIGFMMKRSGLAVYAISDVLDASLDTAGTYLTEDVLYTKDNLEVVRACDVIAITTQDRVIKDVVREIDAGMGSLAGKMFFHTSGADPSSILRPLDEKGALLGSLHPLQTFPDIDSAIAVLPDTYIFIEGDEGALEKLTFIGEKIGYRVQMIGSDDKVLYHLSAVFVCNLLCALYYAGEKIMDAIKIDLEPFLPIIRATLKNIEKKGPLMSLTGPVIRGDLKTVEAHLKAMEGMEDYKEVYKVLSGIALKMTRERKMLDGETIGKLQSVLGGKADE
ncbi:MAG: Rossmann-like domain protein [Syntrophorhabdus sp. PtaU1.Bin058]|nr:MAG: Rossmann-like domain protein [Syntrophorhabdus sp. PtaU1.Bin058]